MDAVLEDATIHQRRQTLGRVTQGFGIDDAYGGTLSRIREQKGNKAKTGLGALMWISHSEWPLKVAELCHALAVEEGTIDLNTSDILSVRTLLSCTLGLVTIDEQASTVRLVHSTLQDYLAAHPTLFTTPHSMMAEICLTYLNFQSICELPTTLDTIPPTMPFLHYASCYWGSHARKGMTGGLRALALRHLQRDANHISVAILLRERSVGFLFWWGRYGGRNPDLRGFTGLHYIAFMGITSISVDMANVKRWDPNGRDANGATPLIWPVKYGNCTLTKMLLEQGDVKLALSDNRGLTPLTHAAKAGQVEVVKLLLEHGDFNPESSDKGGRTPLSYAAESGHEGVVKMLLERGDVNPDLWDACRKTPLSYAAESGHERVVKILLRRGDVNPDSSDVISWTPLLFTAGTGHIGLMKALLEQGEVNADSPTMYGRTPLSFAAQYGQEGEVKILLDRGDVNPDSHDEDGRTPLSYAAQYGHEGVVNMLLKRTDVNPDSSDEDGRTPLSYAAQSGHAGVMNILLGRADVNPDSPDEDGWTPPTIVCRRRGA